MTDRFYRKDGCVFSITAETDEEFEAEAAEINKIFEAALIEATCVSWILFKKMTNGADEITNVEDS